MQAEYLSFGTLTVKYQGELSLLQDSLLRRFVSREAEAAFTVTLKKEELLPKPSDAKRLYQVMGTEAFATKNGWHRRFSAKFGDEWKEYAALDYTDDTAVLTVSPQCLNPARCVESCTAFEHLTLCAGALPVHASHIQYRDKSILFAAPSGVGKSTQAALWERYRDATVVNGDKTLLICNEDQIIAAGIPYAGTSAICKNLSAPLQAVVLLEQGKENVLTRLYGANAVMRLMTCVIRYPWHDTDTERALTLAEKIASKASIYCLSCLPEESAVACLEAALT